MLAICKILILEFRGLVEGSRRNRKQAICCHIWLVLGLSRLSEKGVEASQTIFWTTVFVTATNKTEFVQENKAYNEEFRAFAGTI